MVKLKVTMATGEEQSFLVTPVIEWAFENYAKKGLAKAFREDEKASDIYWLVYECMRQAQISVPPFGADFLKTLLKVEVEDEQSPNG